MNEAPPLSVEYQFTRRDYLHFCVLTQMRSPFLWATALVVPLIICIAAIVSLPADAGMFERFVVTVVAISIGILLGGFIVVISIVGAVLFQPGLRTLLGRKRVTLAAHAVLSEADFIKTENLWPGILRLVRGKHYLMMYNTALSAYVIPRRAFACDEDWDRFFDFARHKFETSRTSATTS